MKLVKNKLFHQYQNICEKDCPQTYIENSDNICKVWKSCHCLCMFTLSILVTLFLLLPILRPSFSILSTYQVEIPKVITCYFNTPDENSTHQQLLPSDIHPHLCTHINIAFARVVNKEIYLDHSQQKTIKELVKLKRSSPALKVLLSVGGAGGDHGFPEMVKDHSSRKTFIRSIKSVLRNYSLDGVDLDWEFPAFHYTDTRVGARERQHFSQLLREIRMEYIREKRDYLLTVALAAPQTIVDISYDIDQINLYVDFANLMTYDFHYFTKFTPFTGFNSPLYARGSEELFFATLNVNSTVNMYLAKGLDKNKIVVGIPTYGHTFSLVNVNNPSVGSPAFGFGSLGSNGFVNYPDICLFLKMSLNNVTVKYEEEARVPYLYSGKEWVSYDSPISVGAKADYIKGMGLRGAMIYSLNADDFVGKCGTQGVGGYGAGARFPLAQSIRRALRQPSLNTENPHDSYATV